MATAQQLLRTFDDLLQPERFKDYGPNGYGAPAVAGHVAAQLGLEHRFIDIDNPA